MAKKYNKVTAINDMVGVLALAHGVKKAIEHTGEFEFMASEEHAREMLGLIGDAAGTLAWLKAEFEKELRDAVARRHEKEMHE